MTFTYEIKFYSDWHCGSGLSSGADIDNLVLRNKCGLPYIPGKTLKGLLREAAEMLKEYNPNQSSWKTFIKTCFGNRTNKECHNQSNEGFCYFSNGELSHTIQKELKENSQHHFLFRQIASTAIDENGQTKEHSLRTFEVVVPLTLFAEITFSSEMEKELNKEEFNEKMNQCLQWTKRLGTKRNRGFGRCDLTEANK